MAIYSTPHKIQETDDMTGDARGIGLELTIREAL